MELNIRQDHIHMVIEIPPKYAVSSVLGYMKGRLALKLFLRYEKMGEAAVVAGLWCEYRRLERGADTEICPVAGEERKRS